MAEYIARVRERFANRLLTVILFGSKARGDADVESDIDLLLLVDRESREFRSALWEIASDVSLEYDVVLSARIFDQSRWEKTDSAWLPLQRAIMAEGIVLFPEPKVLRSGRLGEAQGRILSDQVSSRQ